MFASRGANNLDNESADKIAPAVRLEATRRVAEIVAAAAEAEAEPVNVVQPAASLSAMTVARIAFAAAALAAVAKCCSSFNWLI